MNSFNDFDHWKDHMRASIAAASIAVQAFDKLRSGRGAPDVDDMRHFAEEGEAVADLWVESLGEHGKGAK